MISKIISFLLIGVIFFTEGVILVKMQITKSNLTLQKLAGVNIIMGLYFILMGILMYFSKDHIAMKIIKQNPTLKKEDIMNYNESYLDLIMDELDLKLRN